ncbi:MAG TPA: Calx-beta domain-containing protein [Allosphingosinicella sp.]|nr:Calx-beta domain-containing protein [Allosphingosinicella sp.]
MKSNLLATRLGLQNPDFLESLRADNWLVGKFSPMPQVAQAPQTGPVSVNLTTSGVAYTQNFDALASTGSTGSSLPTDWTFSETGGSGPTTYSVGTGSSNTGDTWSFGVAGTNPITDRAFGGVGSGTVTQVLIGTFFVNNTGSTITELAISYFGEQWRNGSNATQQKLDFQISFNATSLTTGTWTDVNALDFLSLINTTAPATALDGNAAANRVSISSNITSLTIANGATFWIRWVDVNDAGNDHGLAIDDFSLTPTSAPPPAETQAVQFNPTSVTHDEGNTGTTAYSFTVTRTGGTLGQLNFSGTIAAGSTDNADYVGGTAPTTFSGSILAGQTSATVTVNVQGDFTIEPNEAFTLTLTSVSNTDGTVTANIGANLTATGNITNDDAAGAISVDDVSLAEGDTGTTAGSFTVHRTGGVTGTVTVDYVITLPGGVGGADGADVSGPLTGTVTFLQGETTASIPFTVNGDVTNEPNETFTVALSNATGGATIGDGSATATITNDDAPPTISIGDSSLVEGDDGVTYMVFTVSLSKVAAGTVTVNFDASDGSAVAASDYVDVAGQVSFAPGVTVQTVRVPIIGDDNAENNETLTVTLSSPVGATIADGSGTGTITNDDGALYYSLAGGSFSQNWTNTGQITADDNWSGVPYIIGYLGDIDPSGATTNVDPRTLTGANLGAIDVIANLTATTSTSGGVGEFQIANPVVGLQGSGTADAPSLVLYMDATGRSSVRLQANLRDIDGTADNAPQQINVQYRTSPGGTWTNVPGGYFADVTTGPSLATQVTALDVTLPAGADNAATLEIRIMTTNAVGNDEWVGIDDIIVSSAVSGPVLSIANTAVFEGDAGPSLITFTVTRGGSSTGAVTADYAVAFGGGPFDANAADFTGPLTGQVSFADGQTSATITLSVNGDTGPEGDENFTVLLSNASGGATIADGSATGTIVNDDGTPPLVSINDVTVTEGDGGTSLMTFTVTRTGGTGAFDVDWQTANGSATAPSDYAAAGGTLHFGVGQTTDTISITINGDTDAEFNETLQVLLSGATNFALVTDGTGIGTIAADDPIYIHMIQGTSYFSPILAAEGITTFNTQSAGLVTVRAIITAVDNDGPRQGFYLQEEITDWDGNNFTSEGIFVMTRNDAGIGTAVAGVAVGDLVTVTAHVMEYQGFANNMPITALTNPSSIVVNGSGNTLPALLLDASHPMPTAIMTLVQPDYTDSSDGVGDTFDASLYALSFWETVEGMLVTIPDMVVADGFVSTSGGQPIFQAYSQQHADADQINGRGGYTIAGDPPVGQLHTPETVDDTIAGGRHLSDGDVNPDIIEIDFTGFAIDAPAGLTNSASMGDYLGDVTGIVEFDFTDRKLFVTDIDAGSFVDHVTTQEITVLGDDSRSLTVATFNVENLDPGDGAARFAALAAAIANNLNMPDILSIEEMQDNNGAAAGDGISPTGTDASITWQMLVDALNTLTGAHYQWVDQAPIYNAEGGEQSGNIRVGFLYNTDRVQLGDLDANATLAERRMYTDRIGDGVRDAGDLIQFSDDMLGAEIQTADWSNTRRSLLGQFTFNGNTVFVTANHFPAKGGSDEFWQFNQNPATGEPTNAGWTSRNAVAQDVYSMLNLIESGAPGSGIVSGGDYNDFYFYRPLTTVTGYTMADGTARVGGARFDNLTLHLAEAERYTYNFDGRSQAIDHIIVNSTLGAVATYDVVHINTGFNASDPTPLSDHDPGLSSFDFRSFSERLFGTAGADTINGFGGNDVIDGLGGDDTLTGGPGDDTFYVDSAGDTVIEAVGEGNDRVLASVSYVLMAGAEVETLEALNPNDTTAINLQGNEFANRIIGNAGANILTGNNGDDVLMGRAGSDTLRGGAGFDTASYALATAGVVASLATNTGSGGEAAGDTFNSIEKLEGSQFNDTLTGGTGNDTLSGLGGIDTLSGGSGTDTIDGGAGNDALTGGNDNDLLNGGDDNDTLDGGNDADTLNGDAGSDTLNGGNGDDMLNGGTGADTLSGGNNNDTLNGGAGNDVLTGGIGNDVFSFSEIGGADRITDFQHVNDKLDLTLIDAVAGGADNAFTFIGGAAFSNVAGQLRAYSSSGTYFVAGDVNGDGVADFTIQTNILLVNTDFVL